MKDTAQAIAWIGFCFMLYILYIVDYANDMGKKKRKTRGRKTKTSDKTVTTVVKQGKLRLCTEVQNKELNLTGKFRVYKNANGTRLLIQRMSDCKYTTPTVEQVKHLVTERLIDKELGSSVPTK